MKILDQIIDKLPPARRAKIENRALKLIRQKLDPDDAPELTKEQFARANLYRGDKLVSRGRPREPRR